jgi:hypothetical protein
MANGAGMPFALRMVRGQNWYASERDRERERERERERPQSSDDDEKRWNKSRDRLDRFHSSSVTLGEGYASWRKKKRNVEFG